MKNREKNEPVDVHEGPHLGTTGKLKQHEILTAFEMNKIRPL